MSSKPAEPAKQAPAVGRGRHGRDIFVIEGEGTFGPDGKVAAKDDPTRASGAEAAAAAPFRFSRMGPKGTKVAFDVRRKIARAMTVTNNADGVPAGYTYLGQFVDHDFTFDKTQVMLGEDISPTELLQGRSPSLDLDSVYGAGPLDAASKKFYSDGKHLKVGKTTRIGNLIARVGFDVPRVGTGANDQAKRKALIPDLRNDENLAVAQHHAAFIRFHKRVLDTLPSSVPDGEKFFEARRKVVLHYQWMLRTDYLPRIMDGRVAEDVFKNGRKIFEVGADPLSVPTMPIEFAVAGFRLGHSMVREAYDWNREFPDGAGTLDFLFTFSATSGNLGGNPTLPSNWIVDWRRFYPFDQFGRADLKAPAGEFNRARRIDSLLVDPLAALPIGSFGGKQSDVGTIQANLAFRNVTRASMLSLASGQQMAAFLRSKGVSVTTLTAAQLRDGSGGAVLSTLTAAQRTTFLANTPLWFYILREAELNNGKLTGVGARIVAETFHRAMEGSKHSIVRNPGFRPSLGQVAGRFGMPDLMLFAFQGKEELLNPLGD
ncbi:peroxidase family protein [Nocardioides speluncae]|uniref:peroxidase family protein n=1 Tax=Nocardioides speluncae TaxID=2670337 RepID=UPI000D68E6FD|nr:heme peroxidase family protein [Nocardioides speluncae]